MNEQEKYVEYLENELKIIRDYITVEFDAFNSGSVADDVIGIIEMLDNNK